jgi:carboxyl-terminal processing protease
MPDGAEYDRQEVGMKKLRIPLSIFIFLMIFGLGTWTGIFIQKRDSQMLTVSGDSVSEFRLVEEAWNITRDNYVDRTATQSQVLAYGTIAGMIDSLGDTGHSTFLTPEEVQQENSLEQGQYQGIGAEVQARNGNVVIVAPLDGSPAQKAGLRPGDIILKVDGKPVTDVANAVALIIGPAGTSVTLTIQNSSGENKDVTLVRATINLVSITWSQLPGTTIAHLRVSSFEKGTTAALDNALSAIKARGDSGIILDLRDNPGGLLDEAIGVTSRFLMSGNVLLEKDINGKVTPVPVVQGAAATDLPVVVLVDQGTASAAEIVAGALQDSGRSELVGEKTFGTGTVLVPFRLSDGSEIVLAVQEWLTPSGKTIWHTGLSPNQVVSLAPGLSPLFPESESGLTAQQLQASGDQQLLDALSLLTK